MFSGFVGGLFPFRSFKGSPTLCFFVFFWFCFVLSAKIGFPYATRTKWAFFRSSKIRANIAVFFGCPLLFWFFVQIRVFLASHFFSILSVSKRHLNFL